jgi:hypothetical protein
VPTRVEQQLHFLEDGRGSEGSYADDLIPPIHCSVYLSLSTDSERVRERED